MRAERVDGDLLAEKIARPLDRTPAQDIEAGPAVLVATAVADDRLDRRAGGDEFFDRGVERSTKVGVAGDSGLNILRSTVGIADPFESDRRQVAHILGQFRKSYAARPALIAQLQQFVLAGARVSG